MNKYLLKNIIVNCILIAFAAVNYTYAQTQNASTKIVNFQYSQNPKTNSKIENQKINTNSALKINDENLDNNQIKSPSFESRSVASKTMEIAGRADKTATSPTETYKIGLGDILIISLQNAPGNTANYFTVLSDGSIDYPLAGEMVSVQGLTAEEIEDLLKEKSNSMKTRKLL